MRVCAQLHVRVRERERIHSLFLAEHAIKKISLWRKREKRSFADGSFELKISKFKNFNIGLKKVPEKSSTFFISLKIVLLRQKKKKKKMNL